MDYYDINKLTDEEKAVLKSIDDAITAVMDEIRKNTKTVWWSNIPNGELRITRSEKPEDKYAAARSGKYKENK